MSTLREKLIQAVEFHIYMAMEDQDDITEKDLKDLKLKSLKNLKDLKVLHYDLKTGGKITWEQYMMPMLLDYIDGVLDQNG